ncbi:hypothetical protein [Deinococcus hopiensis]|uniref:hypothetical protein n=1 Tax=Deinococcus hopiensis TaxID=309885 RepID=UPI00111C4015|nr:hypothetical protein [Deinococcus hopiensis]
MTAALLAALQRVRRAAAGQPLEWRSRWPGGIVAASTLLVLAGVDAERQGFQAGQQGAGK